MKIGGYVAVGIVIVAIFVGLIGFSMYMSYNNQEVAIRHTFEQKQIDNSNEFDNTMKTISQTAQVAKFDRNSFIELVTKNSQARAVDSKNLAMAWIKEAVPNVDNKTMINLENIIVSARASFTMRQKELLDLKRQHDILLDQMPASWFLSGRPRLKAVIVTSSDTEKAFKTGKDDNVNLGL